FTSHYSRTYVEAAQLLPATPRMTEAQWRALDLLAELAQELCLEMRLEPGDIQFLNNHVIYHARTPFEDDPAAGLTRLLYRVWLCMPGNRPLPEDHAVLWRDVEAGGLRGGIGQEPLGRDEG
ncbi:MAG: TauD/TfdA family dioxygenase, partial [Pirellulales bacterium]|nr:TauD/TfdA family dioxygenase [Pirellulales bacterium]